jgi:hypothetical protein
VVRWWLSVGALPAVASLSLGACSSSDDDDASRTTTTETSVAAADPTEVASLQFETMWIEQAQIQRPAGMPFGGLKDPHSDAAIEASRQAFEAAARGSLEARRLGAQAEVLYNTGDPADFNETVIRFLDEVCGTDPPAVKCEPDTLCQEQRMDSYG